MQRLQMKWLQDAITDRCDIKENRRTDFLLTTANSYHGG